MTLGIAITLDDGALLVVDGRKTWPLADGVPPDDNTNKIHKLSETVAAISFGIMQATDFALGKLESSVSPTLTLGEFCRCVDSSVSAGWQYLISNLATNVNRNHPTMRAALIVGGLIADQPFTTGAIHTPHRSDSAIPKTSRFDFSMLGGEEQDAQNFFVSKASEAAQRFRDNPGEGVVNDLVKAFIRAAEETIRFVEGQNPDGDIGGTIHYVVIRKTFPYTAGHL